MNDVSTYVVSTQANLTAMTDAGDNNGTNTTSYSWTNTARRSRNPGAMV